MGKWKNYTVIKSNISFYLGVLYTYPHVLVCGAVEFCQRALRIYRACDELHVHDDQKSPNVMSVPMKIFEKD